MTNQRTLPVSTLFGTCEGCGATCTAVFLAARDAETGFCRDCIARTEPACVHPDLLPSMDAPHPRREPVEYEQWLNREKRCPTCGALVPERDL